MTRKTKRDRDALGFGNEMKVTIIRDTESEKKLLFLSSHKIAERRSIARDVPPKSILKQPTQLTQPTQPTSQASRRKSMAPNFVFNQQPMVPADSNESPNSPPIDLVNSSAADSVNTGSFSPNISPNISPSGSTIPTPDPHSVHTIAPIASGSGISAIRSETIQASSSVASREPPRLIPLNSLLRRMSIGGNAMATSSDDQTNTPLTTRQPPNLIPLNSLLKQPKKTPFNVRRKSIDARMVATEMFSVPSTSTNLSTPSTPSRVPRGTATQIVIKRAFNLKNPSDSE